MVKFEVNSISKKIPVGYILNVDLKYPDKLHVFQIIIHRCQKNLQFLMTYSKIIVKKLLKNMK